LIDLDLLRLLEEVEVGRVVGVPMVDRLARALEVFWAKAAKERRLRREIEPTTDPDKIDWAGWCGSVAGVVEEGRTMDSGTAEPAGTEGRYSSPWWFVAGRVGIEGKEVSWVNQTSGRV
jgi:hypothetical protein